MESTVPSHPADEWITGLAAQLYATLLKILNALESGCLLSMLEANHSCEIQIIELNRENENGDWEVLWSFRELPDFRFHAEGEEKETEISFLLTVSGTGPFQCFTISRSNQSRINWIIAREFGAFQCTEEALKLKELMTYFPGFLCKLSQIRTWKGTL